MLRDWARERGTPVWVRLVKGAYWDYETIHARPPAGRSRSSSRNGRPTPTSNGQSRFVLRNSDYLRPALASHNIRSLAHGMAVARHIGLPQTGLELQMLYGMADAEKQVFVDLGYRLRIYMPYGDLIPGMAYLVRRLLENTSNDSFLRASFTEHVAVEKLLMNPSEHAPRARRPPDRSASRTAVAARPSVFRNEPATDFALEANRVAMRQALDSVRGRLGQFYPLVIDGQSVDTAEHLDSINPSHRREVVGTHRRGRVAETDRAVAAARRAWPAWAATPVGRAGRVSAPGRRRHAPPAVRAGRLGSLRMRQGLARGRRRRLRGDRLLPNTTPTAPSSWPARTESTCRARRIASNTCRAAWRR